MTPATYTHPEVHKIMLQNQRQRQADDVRMAMIMEDIEDVRRHPSFPRLLVSLAAEARRRVPNVLPLLHMRQGGMEHLCRAEAARGKERASLPPTMGHTLDMWAMVHFKPSEARLLHRALSRAYADKGTGGMPADATGLSEVWKALRWWAGDAKGERRACSLCGTWNASCPCRVLGEFAPPWREAIAYACHVEDHRAMCPGTPVPTSFGRSAPLARNWAGVPGRQHLATCSQEADLIVHCDIRRGSALDRHWRRFPGSWRRMLDAAWCRHPTVCVRHIPWVPSPWNDVAEEEGAEQEDAAMEGDDVSMASMLVAMKGGVCT